MKGIYNLPRHPLRATAPHFGRAVKSPEEAQYIGGLIKTHFPDTQGLDPARFSVNTHPHFLFVKPLREKLVSFLSLTRDSLPPLWRSLFPKQLPGPTSWFQYSRFPKPADANDWLEVHPDLSHAGLRKGTIFHRKTLAVSPTEVLIRIQLAPRTFSPEE